MCHCFEERRKKTLYELILDILDFKDQSDFEQCGKYFDNGIKLHNIVY